MSEESDKCANAGPVNSMKADLAGAVPLAEWQKAAGISRTTAFYWRRSGKLKVIYRYGRAFVSAEESRRLVAHDKESQAQKR